MGSVFFSKGLFLLYHYLENTYLLLVIYLGIQFKLIFPARA